MSQLGVSDEELILLGVIVGTDFNEGARGYGPKKALKLVREHLGFDTTLARVGIDAAEAREVVEIFRHPSTAAVAPPTFGPVDEAAILRQLVGDHGFSEPRVKAAIGRARHRPVPVTSPTEARSRQTLLDTFGGSTP